MKNKIRRDNLKVNFILQILYQIIILAIPLIQSPILTRALGDTSLGNFTYVNSIAYYFLIFAKLGIDRHGQRIIATNRDDDVELRKKFWSLFVTHAVFSIFSLFAYFIVSTFISSENKTLFLINGLYVASVLFDITWLFYGLETFKSVVLKNLFIKVIEFVLIIFLIKSPQDINLYAVIFCGGTLLGNVLLWPTIFKNIKPTRFSFSDCLIHIKPLLILSISSIAASLYTMFDKTLLGILSSKESVAYYEFANKIVNVPKAFTAVVGTVLFPRACALAAKGDSSGQRLFTEYAFLFVSFISFASAFLLLSFGPDFSVLYYGEVFIESGRLMQCMGWLVYIVGIGDVVRNVYLIPMHKDLSYVICICINAVINIVLSIILIPVLGMYGAVIGTISAETFGLVYQLILSRKEKPFGMLMKATSIFATIGLLMFATIIGLKSIMEDGWKYMLIEFIIGVSIYLILSGISILIFYPGIRKKLKEKIVKIRYKNMSESINNDNTGGNHTNVNETDN